MTIPVVSWQALLFHTGIEPHPMLVPFRMSLPDSPDHLSGARQMVDQLRQAGLIVADDQPHPDLVATMQLLASPTRQLYAVWGSAEITAAVVAENSDGDGVVAVRDGDTMRLAPIRGGQPHTRIDPLAGVFSQVLPARSPGGGAAISVSEEDYQAALGPDRSQEFSGAVLQPLHGAPRGRSPVTALRQVLTAPRRSRTQIFAQARDRMGRRHDSAPLTLIDTDAGQWLIVRRTGSVTLAPATSDAAAVEMTGLLRGVTF